jgi:acyl-CoA hydrolase
MNLLNRPRDLSLEEVLPLANNPDLQLKYKIIEGSLLGNLRLGLLLQNLDILAGKTAKLYIDQFYKDARVVTAAIDNILIRNIFRPDSNIILKSRINYVGKTSMEVGIRIEQDNKHIATCYFTMVARIGDINNDEGAILPPLQYVDKEEQIRAKKAIERKNAYLKEKENTEGKLKCGNLEYLYKIYKETKSKSFNGKYMESFVMEGWERTFPEYKNPNQTIFGGYLARKSFELASLCSESISTSRSIVAAVNRINFYHPVLIGDKLKYESKVIYTEGPFICVESNINRIGRGEKKISALTNSCNFTFINVDDKLQALNVEKVYPYSFEDYIKTVIAKETLKSLLMEESPLLLKDLTKNISFNLD